MWIYCMQYIQYTYIHYIYIRIIWMKCTRWFLAGHRRCCSRRQSVEYFSQPVCHIKLSIAWATMKTGFIIRVFFLYRIHGGGLVVFFLLMQCVVFFERQRKVCFVYIFETMNEDWHLKYYTLF